MKALMYLNPSPSDEELDWLRSLEARPARGRKPDYAAMAQTIALRQKSVMSLRELGAFLDISDQAARQRIWRGEMFIQKRRSGRMS